MQLNPFIDVDEFALDIDTGLTDISEAMRTQTQKAAYYGMFHVKARRQLNVMKLALGKLTAAKGKSYRKALIDAGEKPNAANVTELVDTDDAVNAMRKIVIDAEEIEQLCRVAYEAFRTRSSMLTGLGNLTSTELRTGVRTTTAKSSISDYRSRRAARQTDATDTDEANNIDVSETA